MSGGRRRRAPPPPQPPATGVLDWTDSSHWDYDGPRPCRYCGFPTQLRDRRRSPAHKICAEDALRIQAAEAAEAYRRETL